jgi:hypothetical protein
MATITVGIANADFRKVTPGLALLDRGVADKAIRRATRAGYFDWAGNGGSVRLAYMVRSEAR